MVRSIWRFLALGLVLLLTACGGSQSEPVQAPVEVQQPPIAAVTPSATAKVVPTVEEAGSQAEIMPAQDTATAEPSPTIEATPPEAEHISVEATATEPEMTPAETVTTESEVASEAVTSTEEQAASDEAGVTRPGPTAEQLALLADLTDKGRPPELQNEVWLNSDPLKLADLRGKVVIIEFWTFG